MKKICNWVFGSFFRTFGRVLLYLLIGFLFATLISKSGIKLEDLVLMQVKADVVIPQWLENTDSPYIADYFDCSSSTSCNRINDMEIRELSVNDIYVRNFANNTKSLTIGKNGIIIRTQPASRLNVGYLYSASIYVCTSQDLRNVTSSVYPSYYDSPALNENVFESNANSTISGVPGDGTQQWNSCYIFSSIISPGVNGTFLNLRLKSNTSISGYFSIVGFKVEPLGLYTTSIENAVNNAVKDSGFATSESVQDVQNSVTEVKNEVTELNNSQNETNDLIKDDSAPDTESSIDSWSQKLANNPLEAVVMLPLTILNSIKTALSGKCSPLSLTLPFINYKVEMPCISSVLGQIEGATALWNSIGSIVSALMLYKYLIYLYNWIDDTISLKSKRMRGWGSV